MIDRLTKKKLMAFAICSHATEGRIREAKSPGKGPIVHILYNKDGEFRRSSPDTISVGTHLLEAFEAGTLKGDFLDITVEHELNHYLYDKYVGFEPDNIEVGECYEGHAYGGVQKMQQYRIRK